MHTPLKKTFGNPEYLARSRRYDHKCACDICTCGKHWKTQENIGVLSRDPSSKRKPPITFTIKLTRWNRSKERSPDRPIFKPTTIPISFSPATKPPSRLTKCKSLKAVRKRISTSLRKRPFREKASTKLAILPIGAKLSALLPRPARSMCLILPNSKMPQHTNGNFHRKRSIMLPKHSGKLTIMSLLLLPSREKPATRCHSSLIKCSQNDQIRANWIAASTLRILKSSKATRDTDR
jgi:hypothetical protein